MRGPCWFQKEGLGPRPLGVALDLRFPADSARICLCVPLFSMDRSPLHTLPSYVCDVRVPRGKGPGTPTLGRAPLAGHTNKYEQTCMHPALCAPSVFSRTTKFSVFLPPSEPCGMISPPDLAHGLGARVKSKATGACPRAPRGRARPLPELISAWMRPSASARECRGHLRREAEIVQLCADGLGCRVCCRDGCRGAPGGRRDHVWQLTTLMLSDVHFCRPGRSPRATQQLGITGRHRCMAITGRSPTARQSGEALPPL